MKNVIKSIILERQEAASSLVLRPRALVFEEEWNYVLVGLRHAGKSYLLYQHIQTLIHTGRATKEDILFIDFEDERLLELTAEKLNLIIECYQELYDRKPLIFLDEIHHIVGWKKFVRRLADAEHRVFVAGSNSQVISNDILKALGGRFIIQGVFPFSFGEFLAFKGIELKKNWEGDEEFCLHVRRFFSDYFRFGGFAESFEIQDKRSWVNALYQKVLLGDILMSNNIRNEGSVRLLVKKLADSVMQISSLNRLLSLVNVAGRPISRNTLTDYLHFFQDAYLTLEVANFSPRVGAEETIKKRYFWDNGLLNNLLLENDPRLLENLVAINLKKKYGAKVFYYNQDVEVDFLIPTQNLAVQVVYSLSGRIIRKRKLEALARVSEAYNIDNLVIVTFDEERRVKEEGKVVKVVPIWKWLLKGGG
jgi:predicted AAA+ superfamily ATPase